MRTSQVRLVLLAVAVVLHQSASAPVRQTRSAENSKIAQRPAQNCSSIDNLASSLFDSSVCLNNFTLPVGIHHENRQASWSRHSAAQDGGTNPKYTKCRETGAEWDTTTAVSSSSRYLCQWTYECDYDAGRIPSFLHHAKCSNDVFRYNNADYRCKPISTSIQVIRLKGCTADSDTEEWTVEDYVISTACVPFRLP